MFHPRAEVFWQIPHRRDRQDDKVLTNAREGVGMGTLGIDWAINAPCSHNRIFNERYELAYTEELTNIEIIPW